MLSKVLVFRTKLVRFNVVMIVFGALFYFKKCSKPISLTRCNQSLLYTPKKIQITSILSENKTCLILIMELNK